MRVLEGHHIFPRCDVDNFCRATATPRKLSFRSHTLCVRGGLSLSIDSLIARRSRRRKNYRGSTNGGEASSMTVVAAQQFYVLRLDDTPQRALTKRICMLRVVVILLLNHESILLKQCSESIIDFCHPAQPRGSEQGRSCN
jgi:hypothetical protein